ncbi:MAG: hypothetical protein A2624_03900 [Gammaproteobacteria bacterium RIFCSPHIGHO2_01_FULL_42_8]|nr:MAG: hypothetical protein A2624_03900 [Gammaproteobacteria bacterium RIFCSPHIGHO2_01_FULL_42_8]
MKITKAITTSLIAVAAIGVYHVVGIQHAHASMSTTKTEDSAALLQYLMLRLPASNIAYPVYVYKTTPTDPTPKQIAYVTGPSQQVFLGKYDGSVNATFTLYYQQNGWFQCSFTFSNQQVSNNDPAHICPGIVINTPATGTGIVNNVTQPVTSNAWPVVMGATAWSAGTAPANPQPTNYNQQRTLTFVNKTQYAAIQIGMVCTVASNPDNTACQNTNTLFPASGIAQGKSLAFNIPASGIISSAFYVSAYQVTSSDAWQQTGGYYTGQQPYATKFEPTWQATAVPDAATGVPSVLPTNIDVSAVDGFNFGVILYPADSTYCTFTIGEGSNILGVGKYGPSNPLAKLVPTSALSLSQLCQNSQTNGWDLTKYPTSLGDTGCVSPCSYLKLEYPEQTGSQYPTIVNQYCCLGQYGASATDCYGPGLGSSSNYVTQLTQNATHVYTFAYGDADGDYACDGMSNFVIEIYSAPSQ